MVRISRHARLRAKQRLEIDVCKERLLVRLWKRGRTPTDEEFVTHEIAKLAGRAYRVVLFRETPFMFVCDAHDGAFITVIRLQEVQGG